MIKSLLDLNLAEMLVYLIAFVLISGIECLQLVLCFRARRIRTRILPVCIVAGLLFLSCGFTLLAVQIQDMVSGYIGLALLYLVLFTAPLLAAAWAVYLIVWAVRRGKNVQKTREAERNGV